MKNIFRFVFVLSCIAVVLFYSSCKNKCGSTTCQNGGTCVSNKCSCPTGYSGNSCQNSWDGLMIGSYNCSRSNCHPSIINTGPWVSAVTVVATYGGYTINISNFNSSNTTIAATVDSVYNINIAATSGNGVSGRGTFNKANNTISITFTTVSGGGITGYTCDLTMVKE